MIYHHKDPKRFDDLSCDRREVKHCFEVCISMPAQDRRTSLALAGNKGGSSETAKTINATANATIGQSKTLLSVSRLRRIGTLGEQR